MMLVACSLTVPADEVYGTYVASYPFGKETITLNRDGTFVQCVVSGQEQPVTVRGKYDFDPKQSQVGLYGPCSLRMASVI
jgi:hypothetical protein